jgi:hypothetical protein
MLKSKYKFAQLHISAIKIVFTLGPNIAAKGNNTSEGKGGYGR